MKFHRSPVSRVTSILLALVVLLSNLSVTAAAAPSLMRVDPQSAPNDVNTTLTLTGDGFEAGAQVKVGETLLTRVALLSPQMLTANLPWGMTPGTYAVTVTNPGGETVSLPTAFTVKGGFGVWSSGGPYGGGIMALAANGTHLIASVEDAGIYRKSYTSNTWEVVYPSMGARQLVVDPDHRNHIYAAGMNRILESNDSGATWNRFGPSVDDPGWNYNQRIALDPYQPGRLYLTASPPNFLAGNQSDMPGAIYRSDDYGKTWQKINNGLIVDAQYLDTQTTDVAVDPLTPGHLLLGTRSGGIYESTNSGDTWVFKARMPHAINGVYFNPYVPGQALLVIDSHYDFTEPPFLYRSTDLENWTATPISSPDQPNRDCYVEPLAFVNGQVWASCGNGYASTDGINWTPLALEGSPYGVAVDPDDHDHQFYGTPAYDLGFSGVMESNDNGQTWTDINHGLSGVVTRVLKANPLNIEEVYATTNIHGLIKSTDAGRTWQPTGEKSGAWDSQALALDPFDSQRVYYGKSVYKGDMPNLPEVRVSADGGKNWDSKALDITGLGFDGWNSQTQSLFVDPHRPGYVYAYVRFTCPFEADVCQGLYPKEEQYRMFRSVDSGATWSVYAPDLGGELPGGFAFDPLDGNVIYLQSQHMWHYDADAQAWNEQWAHLWRSDNGGQTWTKLPIPENPDNPGDPKFVYEPAVISLHPEIPGKVFIMWMPYANFGGGMFVSNDKGQTWSLTGGANEIIFVKTARGWENYFGSDTGLLFSDDGGLDYHRVPASPRATVTAVATAHDSARSVVYTASSVGYSTNYITPYQAGKQAAEPSSMLMAAGIYRVVKSLDATQVRPQIKIGLAGDFSCWAAQSGWQTANSAHIAIDQINAEGGVTIGGTAYDLTLVTADNACDNAGSAAVAQDLIDAGVVAVIGHTGDGETLQAEPVYHAAGIPLIITDNGTKEVTRQDFDNVFRMITGDEAPVRLLAQQMVSGMRLGRAAVLVYTPLHNSDADLFPDLFKAAGGVVTGIYHYSTNAELATALNAMQADRPGAVFYADMNWWDPSSTQQRIANLRQGLDNRGMSRVYIASTTFMNEPVQYDGMANIDRFLLGVNFRGYGEMPGWENYAAWIDAFGSFSDMDPPDFRGAAAYDAARLLAQVIESGQSSAPAEIIAGLRAAHNFTGLAGTYSGFDANGDLTDAWSRVLTYQGGAWSVVQELSWVFLPTLGK